MNEGPDLLLATRQNILAASFHTNVSGNLDALDFFRAPDGARAESIARRRQADFVLLCRDLDRGYVLADPTGRDTTTALPHPFALSLLKGELPQWLQPIPLSRTSDILLYRVLPKGE